MKHLRLIIAVLIIGLTFIISLFVAIIPALLLHLVGLHRSSEAWKRINGTNIARIILWSLGVKTDVGGLELIPTDEAAICFVSNHQSMLDIPLVMARLGIWAGFITKSELKKVPILNFWINAMHCVYIDRKSPRSSIDAILKGVKHIKEGIPMFIFPEGTRSKTGELGAFKAGSLKLATRAKATIVPIAIDGSNLIMKRQRGTKHHPVRLHVLTPIPTADLQEEELKVLPQHVFSAIEKQFMLWNSQDD